MEAGRSGGFLRDCGFWSGDFAVNAPAAEWRQIAQFPDYMVSSDGQIMRFKPDARGHRVSGKPLVQAASKSGYLSVSLCNRGSKKNVRVNRVVCEAFHGPAPSALHHAAHSDGNRQNNCAGNLRWADPTENEADKRLHGTAAIGSKHWSKLKPERRSRGEGHGLARLTDEQVLSIRSDSRTQRQIAQDHGVSQRAVWNIKNGTTWRHVA